MMKHAFLTKIFLAIVLIVAAFFVLNSVLLYNYIANQIRIENERIIESKLDAIEGNLDMLLNSISFEQKKMAHNSSLINILTKETIGVSDEREIKRLMEEFAWSHGHLGVRIDIYILSKKEHNFSNAKFNPYTYVNLQSEGWWIEFLSLRDQSMLLDSVVSPDYPYTFKIIRPIRTVIQQETVGALIFEISERVLFDSYKDLTSFGEKYFVVNSENIIISSHDKSSIGEDFLKLADSSGEKHKTNNLLRWSLASGCIYSVEDIIQEGQQRYFKYILYSLFLLVFFILIAFLLAYRISSPIRELNEDMKKLSAGDYTVKTKVSGNNEIGLIANTFNEMAENMHNILESTKKDEKVKGELKLNFLRAQINPHFIYNTLTSIRFLIDMDKNEEASEMLLLFTKLLRHSLSSDVELVPLKYEIDNLKNYVELQSIRYSGKVSFKSEISAELEQLLIPSLILQPVVENSIFHGANCPHHVLISLTGYVEGDVLHLSVRDNGTGMSASRLAEVKNADYTSTSSIGLNNVNERIKLYYGDDFGILVESVENEGTAVHFTLSIE